MHLDTSILNKIKSLIYNKRDRSAKKQAEGRLDAVSKWHRSHLRIKEKERILSRRQLPWTWMHIRLCIRLLNSHITFLNYSWSLAFPFSVLMTLLILAWRLKTLSTQKQTSADTDLTLDPWSRRVHDCLDFFTSALVPPLQPSLAIHRTKFRRR
jgi:hypothetical protein